MKGRIVATIIIGFAIAICLQGCKGDAGPAGPAGPIGRLSGNLYGRVSLYDEDSTRITNNSGVTISVASVNSAQSTREGWWTLYGLSAGIYTVVFSKPGYGTFKYFGLEFVGGDSLYFGSTSLVNIPRYYFNSFTASFGADSVLNMSGTISSHVPHNGYRNVMIFVDTTATVSSTRYVATFAIYVWSDSVFSYNETRSDLITYYGIPGGSRLWLVAYGSSGSYFGYYDPTLRRNVFPSLSLTPSSVVDVLLP